MVAEIIPDALLSARVEPLPVEAMPKDPSDYAPDEIKELRENVNKQLSELSAQVGDLWQSVHALIDYLTVQNPHHAVELQQWKLR